MLLRLFLKQEIQEVEKGRYKNVLIALLSPAKNKGLSKAHRV